MPPLALLAALGVLAFLSAKKPSMPTAQVGLALNGRPVTLPGVALLAPVDVRALLPAEPGFQSLTAAEKVRLFSDMQRRLVVDGGRVDKAEALLFADPKDVGGKKAASATDVLYGANMGLGLPEKLAILVGKNAVGQTMILADGTGWQRRVLPGSPWNIFLRPGEAMDVARAARVSVKGGAAAPSNMARVGRQTLAAPLQAPVLQRPVASSVELGALLTPPAGFVSDEAEVRAITGAGTLPEPLAIIRDNYVRANNLYMQNETGDARAFSSLLAPTVLPLRDAGYALASAQIQTLLAKVGAPIDAAR
jgi:hypothetical protein